MYKVEKNECKENSYIKNGVFKRPEVLEKRMIWTHPALPLDWLGPARPPDFTKIRISPVELVSPV